MQNVTSAQETASALTDKGIEALRSGDRERAHTLLNRAVQIDPQCERAWLWLSGTVNSPRQRRECLERVLSINPNNDAARRGLAQLPATTSVRVIGDEPRSVAPAVEAPRPAAGTAHALFDEATIPESNPNIMLEPERPAAPAMPAPPAPPMPEPSRRNPTVQRLPRGSEIERAAREIRPVATNGDALVAQLRALSGVSADLRARQPELPAIMSDMQIDSDAPTVIATSHEPFAPPISTPTIQPSTLTNLANLNQGGGIHHLGTALVGLVSTMVLSAFLMVLLVTL